MEPEQVATIDDEIAKPDPNPDMLPAIPVGFALQEQTALHLTRAILKAEGSVERLEVAMKKDLEAWGHLIAAAQSKAESWRACIRDWMLRNDVKQLKAPWAVTFLQKGRRKLTWQEEDKILAILDILGAKDAIKTTRSVVKKEFTTIYDSVPKQFEGLVEDVTGDSILVIKESK